MELKRPIRAKHDRVQYLHVQEDDTKVMSETSKHLLQDLMDNHECKVNEDLPLGEFNVKIVDTPFIVRSIDFEIEPTEAQLKASRERLKNDKNKGK